MSSPEDTGERSPGWLGRARQLAPWGIAAAIFFWLFEGIAVEEALAAARGANLWPFVAATSVAVVYWFLLESRAFAYLFSRFNAPLSWPESRSLRGLTYLLTPINWNLGTAAIVLHLRASKGVGALESSSSLVFYGMVDGIVMTTLLAIGAATQPADSGFDGLVRWMPWIVVWQLVSIAALMADRPHWKWLEKARGFKIFQSHRKATLRDLGVLVLVRSFYFSGFVAFLWLGTHAFNVDLPLVAVLITTPLVLMSGALPITPSGLGTQQAAMLFLWRGYGDEAAILAFGLAFPVALILGRIPIGLVYLRDLGSLRRTLA